jgi:hypothetical protein
MLDKSYFLRKRRALIASNFINKLKKSFKNYCNTRQEKEDFSSLEMLDKFF